LDTFKTGFAHNYSISGKMYQTAVEEIDKSINHLQKTKETFLFSKYGSRSKNRSIQGLDRAPARA
jgi:hypothetical protein